MRQRVRHGGDGDRDLAAQRYKCPKEIFVTDSLPKNAAGKVLRKVLRENYRDRTEVQ
jgi:acyl-CoA synthetase (AMP-forming)/AMP-acid ligase II